MFWKANSESSYRQEEWDAKKEEKLMMTKGAERAMNSLTLTEAIAFQVKGYAVIVGNGQVTAIVPEERAEAEEVRRCENGY